jgi:hypothetical protein
MPRRPRPKIDPLPRKELEALMKRVEDSTYEFEGQFEVIESALGMLLLGRLVGWKVLLIIHNRRTIAKYEKILGINIREEFPEEGPYANKSLGYEFAVKLKKFWKVTTGNHEITNRRDLVR